MSHAAGEKFQRLVEIMARLRAPDGCPWDREQTFDSIKPYLLEETYEVMEAIDARDWTGLREELGDLLLHSRNDLRVRVAEGGDRDAGSEVDEGVAVCIDDDPAPPGIDSDRPRPR